MAHRVEALLVSRDFWIAAVVLLVALPFLLTLIQWAEAQADWLAVCRGLLFGGR